MKKHNTYFAIIFMLLFVFLMSWILPVTSLGSGEFITSERAPIGLVDLFTYPSYLMFNFINVFMLVIVIGGFYAVLSKTSAYRKLLDKIVNIVKGRELLYGIITVVISSLIISLTGFTYEAIIVFPLIIAVVLLLGYDKITAALMTLGPIVTGFIGSTFSSAVNGTFVTMLNANGAELVNYTSLIWVKVIAFVVANAILVLNIWFYAKKHRDQKNISKSMFIPEEVKTDSKKSNKLWPVVTVLIVTLLLFILGKINFEDAFSITFFSDILEKFNELVIFNYPLLSKILGTVTAFGKWTYTDYIVLIMIMTMIVKLVYRVKFADLIDSLFDGIKNYAYAATLMLFSYVLLIATSNHPVILTILKPLLQLTEGFHSVTFMISTFVSAVFNSDLSFYNYVVFNLNYMVYFVTDTTVFGLSAFITQAMYGLAMLVAPTSIVLLFVLATLEISFIEWFKRIWKLFLALLLAIFVIVTVVLLII